MSSAYLTKGNDVVVTLERVYDEGCADKLMYQHKYLFEPDYNPRRYGAVPNNPAWEYKRSSDYVDPVDLELDVVVPVAVFRNEEGACLYLDDGSYKYLDRYHNAGVRRLGVPHPDEPEYLLVGRAERVGTVTRKVHFPFYATKTRVMLKNKKEIRDVRHDNGFDSTRMDPVDGLEDEDYLCLSYDVPGTSNWLSSQLHLEITL